MNQMLLQNGTVLTPQGLAKANVFIRGGRIVSIGDALSVSGVPVVSCENRIIVPGFADVHVHLREPGFSYKETIATGTAAAARGGYTALCSMPNLNPCPDTPENLQVQLEAIQRDAVVRVYPYGCITRGRRGGGEITHMAALHRAGAVAFTDDGTGVQQRGDMLAAMKLAAKEKLLIAAHCEDESLLQGGCIHDGDYARAHGHRGICSASEWKQVERDIELVRQTGCRYHVCHISCKETVALVRAAKAEGLPVTCETGPHYLTLCDQDLQEDGRFKMNPPLRSASDRAALIEGLIDGTIDCIATDHAPHSAQEKARGLAESAMGVVGLETAFGVLYTHLVLPGRLSLETLVDRLAVRPRQIFGLPGGRIQGGQPADLAVIDPAHKYTIDPARFVSMGKASPFAGMAVQGEITMTMVNGRIIYDARI